MNRADTLLVMLVTLAFVAVVFASPQVSKAIAALGSFTKQLTVNVVGVAAS